MALKKLTPQVSTAFLDAKRKLVAYDVTLETRGDLINPFIRYILTLSGKESMLDKFQDHAMLSSIFWRNGMFTGLLDIKPEDEMLILAIKADSGDSRIDIVRKRCGVSESMVITIDISDIGEPIGVTLSWGIWNDIGTFTPSQVAKFFNNGKIFQVLGNGPMLIGMPSDGSSTFIDLAGYIGAFFDLTSGVPDPTEFKLQP